NLDRRRLKLGSDAMVEVCNGPKAPVWRGCKLQQAFK
ncbi:hypothetical protein ABIC03_001996, partial [Bradyrhizobium sp. RT6a]